MSYVKKENACDMLNRHFKTLEGNDAQVLVSDIKQDLMKLPNASVIEMKLHSQIKDMESGIFNCRNSRVVSLTPTP